MPMGDPEVARPKGSDAPSWEYHIERFAADSPAEEQMLRDAQWLNALGAEGWELANIYTMWRPKDGYAWKSEWGQALVFCIFKRRVAKAKRERRPFEDE
jgi:hypothetical protein